MIRDLVRKNRSYRRFYQDVPIEHEILRDLVDLARLCGSAANRQALKYIISSDSQNNALIFPHIRIDNNPVEGERPSAYIVVLEDTRIKSVMQNIDCGITAQTILLGAVERGFGGCMVGDVLRDDLREALNIPSHFDIILVIALGKPKEEMIIEAIGEDGFMQQWWDEKGARHLYKRALDDIIVKL